MPVINTIQRTILSYFPQISESGHFYLTGGTALAYFYLQHRKSNDLDFFTSEEEIILPFSFHLEEFFKAKNMEVERRRGLHSFVELIIKQETEETMIHLALFGRATFRDFVDIYFLVNQAGFTEGSLIKDAKIKDPGFDLYWLGVAFERINTFQETSPEMLLLLNRISFKEIDQFFNGWRQRIAQQLSQ